MKDMNNLKKKWGLIIEVLVIVSCLLILKRIINFFDLDTAAASPLITALV